MRIIVTGASGFIGSHLCRDLLANGHEVAILTRCQHPRRLRDLNGRLSLIPWDLNDLSALASAIVAFAPDAVAHLGWQGVAGVARQSMAQVNNIGWTAAVLEQGWRAGARVFLGAGSQAEYGPKAEAISPDADPRPTTLYGETKLAAGRIGARLAASLGMRFIWMRIFSTFGPDDHPYWMLPSVIGALLRGRRPALTAGDQLWDFLPVADAAAAMRLALESDKAEGVYNLGSGRAPRLRDTIEAVRDLIDPTRPLGFGEIPYRTDQVMRLQADISALQRDTKWAPSPDITTALAETVAWYRANDWVFELEGTA